MQSHHMTSQQTSEQTSQHQPAITVYIIHGYGAGPQSHWFPWLKQQLEAQGMSVQLPALPDPEHPVKEQWDDSLKQVIGVPNENCYFVAHSLGCIALLDYFRQLEPRPEIGGMVLVSGFATPISGYALINPFVGNAFHPEQFMAMTSRRVVVAAKDDPIVPFEQTEQLAHALEARFITVEHGGHFLSSEGFTELPLVYEQLVCMINS